MAEELTVGEMTLVGGSPLLNQERIGDREGEDMICKEGGEPTKPPTGEDPPRSELAGEAVATAESNMVQAASTFS
jgi:hypothetical protein